jgi:hypothetical protein
MVWKSDIVYGGLRVTPRWPRDTFAWSWALETDAPPGYAMDYDANGQHPRLVAHV